MRQLLEKILSPVKTFVAAAVITAAVAGMPSEAQGKLQSKDFEYFTQSRNITTGHLVSPPEKGLTKSHSRGGIKSIGNYQERSGGPTNAENVRMEVEQKDNQLSIQYICPPKKLSERLPVYEQMFREDSPNTHIYFLFPEHVTPLRESQSIFGINNRSMKRTIYMGTPFEDTKLCEAIKNINIAMEEGAKPRDCDTQELERAYDNAADSMGDVGTGLKVMKKGMKRVLEKTEKKRIEKIREDYGKDYQIYKMPFHQIDGPVFKYTYYGRNSTLTLDTSEVAEGDKAYIIIPQISFTQDVAGTTRRATLEDLAYEIPLEPQNIEILREYSEEEAKKILEGRWKSMGRNKKIIVDINRDARGNKVPFEEIGGGAQIFRKGEHIMIREGFESSDGPKVRQYSPGDFERLSKETIKIINQNIIRWNRSREYFAKEGTQIEKLNSLEDLTGTWKINESFIKTLNPKIREKARSGRMIIENKGIALEYTDKEDGEIEREEKNIMGDWPLLKINNVYFIPEGGKYNQGILKANKNLLIPLENPKASWVRNKN